MSSYRVVHFTKYYENKVIHMACLCVYFMVVFKFIPSDYTEIVTIDKETDKRKTDNGDQNEYINK